MEGDHIFLTVEHASGKKYFFVMTRKEGESLAKSSLGITVLLVNHVLSCVDECVDDVLMDFIKVLEGVSCLSFNDVVWLWYANFFELKACFLFNHLNEHLLSQGVECDADA